MLFGSLGDRVGRKPTLILSVVLIGVATAMIGLLPDFFAIGIAAPIMLVVLRLLQGVAVGGEWSGAMTLAVEHAPLQYRNRLTAMVQLSSPIATLMSSGAFTLVLLLPAESFDAWGWRVPFLLAIPMIMLYFLAALIAVIHDRRAAKRTKEEFAEYDLDDDTNTDEEAPNTP